MQRRLARLSLAAACLLPATAMAQSRLDPGIELLRQQQREQALRQLRAAPPGAAVPSAAVPTGQSAVCFPIRDIAIDGVASIDPDIIVWAAGPFRDRCLGQTEIGQLIGRLRQLYLERGFITTQVAVPPQNLKSGTLRLLVVEGQVDALNHHMTTDGRTAEPVNGLRSFFIFPFATGRILQLRDLEQGVAQLNRLGSVTATVDIAPGRQPGTSAVNVLERRERGIRLSAGMDTNGQEATGRNRRKSALEMDDLLGIADTWSLSYVGAEFANAAAASASIPFGYWTFGANGSWSEQDQLINPVADLLTSSASWSASADWVVLRNADTIIHLNQTANWYWSGRVINATQLTPQSLSWARSGLVIERFHQGGRLSVDLGVTYGLPALGGDADAPDLQAGDPHARFHKFDGSATLISTLPFGLNYLGTVSAQWSPVPLFSPNQLSIGGWDAVRGFRDDSLPGDRALVSRNEIQLGFAMPWARAGDPNRPKAPPPAPWADFSAAAIADQIGSSVAPYAFVDAGLSYAAATGTTSHLASAGLGVRTTGSRISIDAAIAAPILGSSGRPSGFEANLSINSRLW